MFLNEIAYFFIFFYININQYYYYLKHLIFELPYEKIISIKLLV